MSELRGRHVELLEIGLNRLGSEALWNEYFNSGVLITGIDRDAKTTALENVHLYQVGQGSPSELAAFAETMGTRFDVIIDDGSHAPLHQLLTLRLLWPTLVPGGIYIIEDIETSYWGKSSVYGYTLDASRESHNTIAAMRASIDAVNMEFLCEDSRKGIQSNPLSRVFEDLEMITFGQNCIIHIKKNKQDFANYYQRTYRFKNRINDGIEEV